MNKSSATRKKKRGCPAEDAAQRLQTVAKWQVGKKKKVTLS